MTVMVLHQSYMTQHPSLFTLINHCVTAFSYALMFTIVVGLLSAMASCSAPVCWLSHMNNKPLSIVHWVSYVYEYFSEKGIAWGNCVRVCIDGVASMTSYRLGVVQKITK